jgi:amino acid permease
MTDTASYTASNAKFTKFDEMSPNSRSFYQRTLGQIKAGALRAAIFTLISTVVGAVCLTLPLLLLRQGIFLGLFLLVFSCLCSYVGVMNITAAAEHLQCYEYSGLVEKILGKPWKHVFDNVLILYVFGTLISYQVNVGNFVPSIFSSLNISFEPSIERTLIMIIANLLVMTPLGLMRKLTSLRFMSIISALTLLYITLLVIIEFPFFAKRNSFHDVKLFDMNLSVMSSFNICLYAFTCHPNVAQVYDELNRRTVDRMSKVATRAMVGVLIPYILLGLFGYLSTLDSTPQLITFRVAPNSIGNDFLMVIGRVLMSFTLVIGVPVTIPSCRKVIIKSWLRVTDDYPSNKV